MPEVGLLRAGPQLVRAGRGERDAGAGEPFEVSPAFYVIVDGFTPAELGITAGDLSGAPGTVPAFGQNPATTWHGHRRADAAGRRRPLAARWRGAAVHLALPDLVHLATLHSPRPLVNVALTASIGGVTANAILELRQEPNPYELDGETFWLSTDLRVFQLKDGQSKFGANLSGTSLAAASELHHPGDRQPEQRRAQAAKPSTASRRSASEVALYQTDSSGTAVFNFAVARVRYRALVDDAMPSASSSA